MMMMDMIEQTGCSVVGPVSTLDEAIQCAREANIDAAILDINLDGMPIYPAAEALSARGIPFVFSTGYEANVIDQRNSGIAVLQKPIDEQMLRSALFACMARSEAGHGKEPVS